MVSASPLLGLFEPVSLPSCLTRSVLRPPPASRKKIVSRIYYLIENERFRNSRKKAPSRQSYVNAEIIIARDVWQLYNNCCMYRILRFMHVSVLIRMSFVRIERVEVWHACIIVTFSSYYIKKFCNAFTFRVIAPLVFFIFLIDKLYDKI